MIKIAATGNFNKTERFLKRIVNGEIFKKLEVYGQRGVSTLSQATPVRTGKTSSSWTYEIQQSVDSFTIQWLNTNVNKGVNIAIILQYGHGTRNGGYVRGIDYINPAMKPIFDKMAQEAWQEVTRT